MRICPECGKDFDDKIEVCPTDRSTLISIDPSSDPMLGSLLDGRYRLVRKIGEGGLGSIYHAVHTQMLRSCAIKLFTAPSPRTGNAIARFKREAKMASRIDSVHAVTIYDFGQADDGNLFLVMEFIDGKPLSRVIADERVLPIGRVIHMTAQIAEALSAAHALGIVHRDLKPDNIMITRKGANADFVKVLDFGIAKALADPGNELTQAGFVLGTPVYMSPEQLLGEELDPRSDIYSLATIVYEALSGRLPFEGANPQAVMLKRVMSDPIRLRAVAPSLSETVELAVMAGLHRNRDSRTPTVGAFASELSGVLDRGTQILGGVVTRELTPPSEGRALGEGLQTRVESSPAFKSAPSWERDSVTEYTRPEPIIVEAMPSSAKWAWFSRRPRVKRRHPSRSSKLSAKSGWLRRRPREAEPLEIEPVQTTSGMTMTVWYGTNRKLDRQQNGSVSYSSERDNQVHVGRCRVYVPESHKIGSLGSSWWQRVLTRKDDRLKVSKIIELDTSTYWEQIRRAFEKMGEEDRRALIYIHGFNVTFGDAALRAAQLGCDLGIKGVVAFYSWPSKGKLSGYGADAASIEASEDFIADFLADFAIQCGTARINVIAHSMGNRGLLRAIHRILGQAAESSKVSFGQIFLAAPDVDRELFLKLAHCYPRVSERTTLYVSDKDRALKSSGILHDFPRAGFAPPVTIIPGIDTVEVSNIDLTLLGHGFFAQARDVLQDMHNLIMHNAPPDRRMGLKKNIPDENVVYWSLKA